MAAILDFIPLLVFKILLWDFALIYLNFFCQETYKLFLHIIFKEFMMNLLSNMWWCFLYDKNFRFVDVIETLRVIHNFYTYMWTNKFTMNHLTEHAAETKSRI